MEVLLLFIKQMVFNSYSRFNRISGTIGIYQDGTWYLDYNGNGVWDTGIDKLDYFGTVGYTPVVGNWNGAATGDKNGIYQDGTWYLDYNGNRVWDTGIDKLDYFGTVDWRPVVGKWS